MIFYHRKEVIYWMEGIILPAIAFFGVIGNVLSVLVLKVIEKNY